MLNRDSLSKVNSYDSFFELRQSVVNIKNSDLFNILFPISIDNLGDETDSIAGLLLIELEPKHEKSCEEMLLCIANSKWDVSNKEIPFYLITQFGKWILIDTINILMKKNNFNNQQKELMKSVNYWVSFPASKLSSDLNYFEWQEIIEGKNA